MSKISIIVPIYNIEQFLPRCLDSILSQTYQNLEIILVDDGSTDDSGKIADRYAGKDERIKVIHQVNSGVSVARNHGLDQATGDYIGFVDGDDYVEPDMYEILMQIVTEYQVDIAHCGYQMVYPSRIDYYYNTGEKLRLKRNEGLLELMRGTKIEPGLWNKLYKAELFKQVRLPVGVAETEDLLCNFEVFSLAENSFFYDVPKYHYILRSGSATSGVLSEKKRRDRYFVISSILKKSDEDASYYTAVYERYLRILIENATQINYQELRDEAVHELRKELRKIVLSKKLGIKIKGMVFVVSYFQSIYRWIHYVYSKA
ncbi:glycosyltransferase, partial [Faecalicatena contorta]|uniref:glycosyltransferase n=1 Tax=Faecalicatena contorta TaxID=39482 RepID=UPI001F436B17